MEQQKLPNATAVLVLSILSIVTCCCFGIFGLIFSIIALILANKDLNLYHANPELYSNYNNLKTGRILAIIGIVLSVLTLIYFAYSISQVGGWDEMMRVYKEALEQAQRNQQNKM